MSNTSDNTYEFYRYLPRFRVLQTEQKFRASVLQQESLYARIIIVGAILISFFSLVPDSLSGTPSTSVYGLYLATSLFCLLSVLALVGLAKTSTYHQFDLITTIWWLSAIAAVTFGNTLYPAGLTIHVVFDVLIPVAIYFLVPIGLVSQFLLAFLFTTSNLGMLFLLKNNLPEAETAFILLAYTATNLLGLAACWQTHMGRRKQYIEKVLEEKLKSDLQTALDELQALRGIIPICCYCKQIRDDEGFWHQVESYVNKHSGAEFTHGICPDCMKEQLPKVYDQYAREHAADPGQGRDEDGTPPGGNSHGMPYQIDSNDREGYLQLTFKGEWPAELDEQITNDLYAAIISSEQKKILLDYREGNNMTTNTMLDYNSAINAAELPEIRRFTCAMLFRPDEVKKFEFWETVAVNRGLNVRFFDDESEALKWLRRAPLGPEQ